MTEKVMIGVRTDVGNVRPPTRVTQWNVPTSISQSTKYRRRIGINETVDVGGQTLFGYFDSIYRIIKEINKKNNRRINLRNILFDDKQKEMIIPNYKAISIINEERNKTGRNYNLFLGKIYQRLKEIERYDKGLATAIGKAIHAHFDKDPLFKRIFLILTRYPEGRIFQHFNNYYGTYEKIIESASNTYLARWAKVLIDNFLRGHITKNQKVTEIRGYNQRIENLTNAQQRRGLIRAEIVDVIKGVENIMGKKIAEIANMRQLTNINPIKHLMMYPDELIYLRTIREKVVRGMGEGMWQEFTEVQKKATTVIAEDLEKGYGDTETAELFRTWGSKGKEGLHDAPVVWANNIGNRIRELQYGWGKIFSDAIKAFDELFAKCQSIVENEFKGALDKIKGKANSLMTEEKREPRQTVKSVRIITSKRRRHLNELIARKREDYLKIEDDWWGYVMDFMGAADRFTAKLNNERLGEIANENTPRIDKETNLTVELGKRLGRYGASYDVAVLSRLVRSISTIRALEREIVGQGAEVAFVVLKYGGKVREIARLANDALDKMLIRLDNVFITNNPEVFKNGR